MAKKGERDETVARRRDRVLRLYAAGMPLAQIAAQVRREFSLTTRYSPASAAVDLRRMLEATGAEQEGLAGTQLPLELERLNGYLRTVEVLIAEARGAGDRWLALRGIDRALRIGERRDQLLGLSAVTRDVVRVTGEVPAPTTGDERERAETDAFDELERKRAERRRAYGG